MWRTAKGERTLIGSEADLVRGVVGFMYDQIDDEDGEGDYAVGVAPFDRLNRAQQLALLAEVASGLLDEDYPVPDLTAVREATIAAIYETLTVLVEMEIDSEQFDEPDRSTRERILAILGEFDPDPEPPNPSSVDNEEWGYAIDVIRDRVLFDDDWDMEELFMDASPEQNALLKQTLDVSDDYFTAPPPDPSAEELEQIKVVLNRLTGAVQ